MQKIPHIIEYIKNLELPPILINLGFFQLKLSVHALLQGLIVILVFYLLLFLTIWANEEKTVSRIEESFDVGAAFISKADDTKGQNNLSISNMDSLAPAKKDSDIALESAPKAGYYEDTESGILPRVNILEKNTPFNVYKKPFTNPENKPLISIVMDDYGISDRLSLKALQLLPGEVSFIQSPYIKYPDKFQEIARADGHEVWSKLPLENSDYPQSDPGPNAILSRMSLLYNTDQLSWNIGRTAGFVGVAAFSDNVFISSEPMFKNIIRKIYERGLGFFELNTKKPSPFVSDVARKLQTPYIKADIFLHEDRWKSNLDSAFEAIETIASTRGHAIVVIKPYPETLIAIDVWKESLKSRGFMLAPLSFLFTNTEPSTIILKAARLKEEGQFQDDLSMPREIMEIKNQMTNTETEVK